MMTIDNFLHYESPRLEYMNLTQIYHDTEELKEAISRTIWNDDRLLREDIKDIAINLLDELKRG
jgi:hypothetical protein